MASVLDAASLVQERYSRIAMWLHWVIAALIIANLLLGFFHEDFGKPVGDQLLLLHKSIGLTVLVLSVARLAWRIANRPPAFDPLMGPWEARMAVGTHWLFYTLMIALPLSGWLHSDATGHPTSFFGQFDVPMLPVSHSRQSHEFWEQTHALLAFTMLIMLVLHLAGAIKHMLEGRGRLVGRMAPWLLRRR
ncbi:MAG: cytochrome b [Sphingomonadales bacterium]